MGWGGDVNVHAKYLRYRCYVVTWVGWGVMLTVNVHVKYLRYRCYVVTWGGVDRKFQYSKALSRVTSFALAALCMDVVLETKTLQ